MRWVTSYMEPLFTQNFKIFAPSVPEQTTQLFIKWNSSKNGWSKWENPSQDLLHTFQSNRFSPQRYPYLIFKKIEHDLFFVKEAAIYFAETKKIPKHEFPAFRQNYLNKSLEWKLTKKHLFAWCRKAYPNQAFLKIKCCFIQTPITPPKGAKRVTAQDRSSYTFFEFTPD